jgi:hypothetical protein
VIRDDADRVAVGVAEDQDVAEVVSCRWVSVSSTARKSSVISG